MNGKFLPPLLPAIGILLHVGYATAESPSQKVAPLQATRPSTAQPGKPATLGTTSFDAAKIEQLREKAGKAVELRQEPPEGWSKSTQDPAKALAVFEALHLKKGFVLRAYQINDGGNGNGVVWAMPAEAEFPEPAECLRVRADNIFPLIARTAPKPPAALDDAMEAIEGDGSAWSYLSASIVSRQLDSFGAMWHGVDWPMHMILDENPFKPAKPQPPVLAALVKLGGPPENWKWLEPQPKEWRPQVRIEKDRVTVTFHTYTGLRQHTIYRHVDTYKPGSYTHKRDRKLIAEGPVGFFF